MAFNFGVPTDARAFCRAIAARSCHGQLQHEQLCLQAGKALNLAALAAFREDLALRLRPRSVRTPSRLFQKDSWCYVGAACHRRLVSSCHDSAALQHFDRIAWSAQVKAEL